MLAANQPDESGLPSQRTTDWLPGGVPSVATPPRTEPTPAQSHRERAAQSGPNGLRSQVGERDAAPLRQGYARTAPAADKTAT